MAHTHNRTQNPVTTRTSSDRERALEAIRMLNNFVGDIITATKTLQHASTIMKSPKLVPMLNRMCITYLMLALAKLMEFYDKYNRFLPQKESAELKAVRRELGARHLLDLRNKVIGHVWDKARKRPLTDGEVDAQLAKTTKGDLDEFIAWINGDSPDTEPSA
jgi:hypothetical protein